jgi:hypothetical protein
MMLKSLSLVPVTCPVSLPVIPPPRDAVVVTSLPQQRRLKPGAGGAHPRKDTSPEAYERSSLTAHLGNV